MAAGKSRDRKKSERNDVSKLQRRYEEIDRLIMPQAAKQPICSPASARPFPDLGFRPRRDAALNFIGPPRGPLRTCIRCRGVYARGLYTADNDNRCQKSTVKY